MGIGLDRRKASVLRALGDLPELRVMLYIPEGAPDADTMPVGTTKPGLTKGRAALVMLLDKYLAPGYRASLIEVQKLMYFMQEAGENLKPNYSKGQYGPYAENLNHVLERLEGHYIRGYGDRTGRAGIRLLPGAVENAEERLEHEGATLAHLARVDELIDGFETPYSLELLATVHWVVATTPGADEDVELVNTAIEAWNKRKRTLFDANQVAIAWRHLREHGWFARQAA